MVLLRPLNDASPYLFGWEMETRIGTAVLRLPQELAVLDDLNKFTDARVAVPPWWPLKGRLKQQAKGLIGRHRRAEYMDWGTFGPKALTCFLSRRDLACQALPVETFYPINWTDVSLFFAMPDAVSPRLTAKTIGVHLWSASIVTGVDGQKAWGTALPPPNSWLGRDLQALRYHGLRTHFLGTEHQFITNIKKASAENDPSGRRSWRMSGFESATFEDFGVEATKASRFVCGVPFNRGSNSSGYPRRRRR